MAHVNWLKRDWCENATDVLRNEAAWISRAPFVIALEVKSITVKLISAALGYGIYNAARRTAILG